MSPLPQDSPETHSNESLWNEAEARLRVAAKKANAEPSKESLKAVLRDAFKMSVYDPTRAKEVTDLLKELLPLSTQTPQSDSPALESNPGLGGESEPRNPKRSQA